MIVAAALLLLGLTTLAVVQSAPRRNVDGTVVPLQ